MSKINIEISEKELVKAIHNYINSREDSVDSYNNRRKFAEMIVEVFSVHHKSGALIRGTLGIFPKPIYSAGMNVLVDIKYLYNWDIDETESRSQGYVDSKNCVDCFIQDVNPYDDNPYRVKYSYVRTNGSVYDTTHSVSEDEIVRENFIEKLNLGNMI